MREDKPAPWDDEMPKRWSPALSKAWSQYCELWDKYQSLKKLLAEIMGDEDDEKNRDD